MVWEAGAEAKKMAPKITWRRFFAEVIQSTVFMRIYSYKKWPKYFFDKNPLHPQKFAYSYTCATARNNFSVLYSPVATGGVVGLAPQTELQDHKLEYETL